MKWKGYGCSVCFAGKARRTVTFVRVDILHKEPTETGGVRHSGGGSFSMLLYEAPGSPYAQKIKIALREKNIAFELEVPDSLGTGRTDGSFGIDNPRAEVPLLVDGPVRIFDSSIILEYIEERWPDPPLLPRDPAARAFARMTEEICDTHYEAVTWGFSEVMVFGRATGALA